MRHRTAAGRTISRLPSSCDHRRTTGPDDAAAIRALGASWWPLRAFRELDDAILRLRVNEPEIGTWILRTQGALGAVREVERNVRQAAWVVHRSSRLERAS